MTFWRGVYAALLLVLAAPPLLVPLMELFNSDAWAWTSKDVARLQQLGLNTLLLTGGTLAIALPLGVALAVLLFRTSFPGRRLLQLLLLLLLFVPLPVLVSSWQALLGSAGLGWWRAGAGRPWATGLPAAIWIHAIAAIPWLACIVGLGLTWVEPEREDEAAQSVGPWRVLALVTLPRVRASVLGASLFVVLQTAGEISVTDMMLVSTLAEETHTQFTLGQRAALARTLVAAGPSLILAWVAVLGISTYLERSLPPLTVPPRGDRPLALTARPVRFLGASILILILVVPLGSLLWKVGLTGHPATWSSAVAWHHLRAESILLGKDVGATLAVSLLTGILTATLALLGCWLARDCRWLRWLLFSVITWAWVLPGPVVGIGLHESIMMLVASLPDALREGPWTVLLYRGPSPVPLIWVQTIRALPAVVVFLWPMVRMIPRELAETARLNGAGPFSELVHVLLPMTWRGIGIAVLAASALSLAEVAASARVETPGWPPFTKLLFDRMHFGVDNNVAALCILLLVSVGGMGLAIAAVVIGRRPCSP